MRKAFVFLASMIACMVPICGQAQLAGLNTRGDFGLQSGTQAPPGFYVVPLYLDYSADDFRDRNGDSFSGLDGGGSVDATATVAGLMWVTDKKILGGNYGFAVWPAVTNNAVAFPPPSYSPYAGRNYTARPAGKCAC